MTKKDRPPEPEPGPERLDFNIQQFDWENLEPPEWLTDLDREILAVLGNSGLIMTPSIIAKNIDGTRSSVSRRLNTLEAGNMVEKVERGHYRITNEGYAKMYQEIPVESPPEREDELDWVTYRIPTPDELEILEEKGKLDW